MTAEGYESIQAAQRNGSWTILDDVEALHIPGDLDAALKTNASAMEHFLRSSRSAKKVSLQWLALARRPETRQKRITEIVKRAGQGPQQRML